MKSDDLPIMLREGIENDLGHIVVTWSKSYASSDFAKPMKFSTYMDNHIDLINETLDTASIIVACLNDDQNIIIGYVVFELVDDETIVHYIHVKPKFRKYGVASLMLDALRANKLVTTHKTKLSKLITKRGVDYNPYLFLRRKQ
jgi:ribosomal protein S18 acetylase RimI-like enzyme